jgi:hypothetical protein
VIRLWINDYVMAAGEPQGEDAVRIPKRRVRVFRRKIPFLLRCRSPKNR